MIFVDLQSTSICILSMLAFPCVVSLGLGGCWIMECLLPYLSMVTVPHIMVRLERMLDYRGV